MRGFLTKWWSWPVWARLVSGLVVLFVGSAVITGIVQGPQKSDAGGPPSATAVASPSATPTVEAVPALIGLTKSEATSAISAAGFRLGGVATRPTADQPAGTVLSESPAAGTVAGPGSVVRLVIAGALPRVPAVIGMSAASATSALRHAGFAVSTSTRTISSGSDGVVLTENPAAGTSEMPGSTVRLAISHVYVAPPPPPSVAQPPAQHSCTLTNSGTCIRGGEFCRQADYGTTGYDADGRAWTCTGDTTHPHWE